MAPKTAIEPHAVATSTAVLIVDSDPGSWKETAHVLGEAGCDVVVLRDSAAAQKKLSEREFDVVIAQENISKQNIRGESQIAPAFIVVSNFGTVEGAVAAMRDGAVHYTSKPVVPEEIVLAVRKAKDARGMRKENIALKNEMQRRSSLGSLMMRDPKMREICSLVETVAQTKATVLILGPSGSGKSVLARAIHHISPRKNGAFVEVNCGALPESLLESELFGHAKGSFTGAHRDRPGRFEAASGGTLFLDEIGTASPSMQLRLLRVLQERVVERVGEERSRPVDVRVILATNQNLENAVKEGRFREDLYYRIYVVAIELPPLRDRPSDIPDLAHRFLAQSSETLGRAVSDISKDAMAALLAYSWPGNVRELENAIERAVATGHGEILQLSDLPAEMRHAGDSAANRSIDISPNPEAAPLSLTTIPLGPLEEMLAICENHFLERALAAANGNRSRAASILKLHRATLYQRMKRVGINTSRT